MYRPRSGNEDDADPDGRTAATGARPRTAATAGDPPLATRAFIEVIVAQLFFGFAYATFVLLPKLLAVDYGASAREIGTVLATFGVLSLAVSPAIGPLAARLGLRRTMAAGDLVLAASALGFMFMTHAGPFAALFGDYKGSPG